MDVRLPQGERRSEKELSEKTLNDENKRGRFIVIGLSICFRKSKSLLNELVPFYAAQELQKCLVV